MLKIFIWGSFEDENKQISFSAFPRNEMLLVLPIWATSFAFKENKQKLKVTKKRRRSENLFRQVNSEKQ